MKAKHFSITLHNYTETDLSNLDKIGKQASKDKNTDVSYLLYGKEIGEKKGGKHLHIYARFIEYQTSPKVICKKLKIKHTHTEVVKSPTDYRKYCKKEYDWQEYGIFTTSGNRTDIEAIYEKVPTYKGKGMTLREVLELERPNAQIMKIIEKYWQELPAYQLEILPVNIWIWGESGTGKTQLVRENFKSEEIHIANPKWPANGYGNQRVFLLDDCNIYTITELIGTDLFFQMFDKWHGTKIEGKGMMKELNSIYRIITSRENPIRIGKNLLPDRRKDIERRFNIIEKKNILEKINLTDIKTCFV